jgi:hypothetical protein
VLILFKLIVDDPTSMKDFLQRKMNNYICVPKEPQKTTKIIGKEYSIDDV